MEDYADNVIPASSKTFIAEYLATSLSSPLNEKDVVGLIEAQAETAKTIYTAFYNSNTQAYGVAEKT